MSKYQLFYFPSCPYCAYVLAQIKSMPVDIELKNISANQDFREELMAGGGKTQVPCLRIEHDSSVEWMYESRDIVDFLEQQSRDIAVNS